MRQRSAFSGQAAAGSTCMVTARRRALSSGHPTWSRSLHSLRKSVVCNGRCVAADLRARGRFARRRLLRNGRVQIEVAHVEEVKSYAPHVKHVVADVHCRLAS